MVNSVTFYGNNILLPYTQVLKPHFSLSFCLFVFQVSIYSIWFYDKNDCHRIAKLMAE